MAQLTANPDQITDELAAAEGQHAGPREVVATVEASRPIGSEELARMATSAANLALAGDTVIGSADTTEVVITAELSGERAAEFALRCTITIVGLRKRHSVSDVSASASRRSQLGLAA